MSEETDASLRAFALEIARAVALHYEVHLRELNVAPVDTPFGMSPAEYVVAYCFDEEPAPTLNALRSQAAATTGGPDE